MTGHEQGIRRRTIAIVAVAALLVLVGGAWLVEARLGATSEASRVRITLNGQELAAYTVDELRAMEKRSFRQLGETQEGPSVLAVLEQAGAGPFDRLTVIGLGVRDDGVLVLDRDAITPDVILDFAATRATVKIAGPAITRDDRVRDITELRVE